MNQKTCAVNKDEELIHAQKNYTERIEWNLKMKNKMLSTLRCCNQTDESPWRLAFGLGLAGKVSVDMQKSQVRER